MPLAGAPGEPVDGARLVFRAADPAVVADFARHAPYGRHGLVTRWTIRPLARSHRRRVRRAVNNFPRQVKGLARLPLSAALQ